MTRRHIGAWALAVVSTIAGAAILSSCAPPPAPTGDLRAQQAATQACRRRADEVFARQHRDTLYLAQDARASPFSGDYVSGVTSRGLSQRYGRDEMVTNCVRSSDTPDQGAGPTFEPAPQ